jgi:endonuclease/exonuclease/phosphatase family metal-dependent hydrolase
MKLTITTWNIGGGKVLKDDSDPNLIASYSIDGMRQIAEVLKTIDPAIVTLQEVQEIDGKNQAQDLAKMLGMPYVHFDSTSESHIDIGHKLGHALISKYPIVRADFAFFVNPHYQVMWEDGKLATSFNKGTTAFEIMVEGWLITIQTLHLVPFRRFEINPLAQEVQSLREDISSKIKSSKSPYILTGDFNYDAETIAAFLPTIYEKGLEEITQQAATTPKGRRYDHILYKGVDLVANYTNQSVLTDHFPVSADFELSN